jgi:hypothetical protein
MRIDVHAHHFPETYLDLLQRYGSKATDLARHHGASCWPRFWAWENGIEYNQLFLIPAIAVTISGPDHFSLDAALGLSLPFPLTLIVGMVLMKIGLVVALLTRLPASKHSTR